MIRRLKTPISSEDLKRVRAGDEVYLSGRILTARDRAHRYLLTHNFKPLQNAVLYHCGPMYEKRGKRITILAAGPTTSARFNHYTPKLLERYGIQAIIGKGGMDEGVRKALKGVGMYCAAIGGAAVYYAHCITRVIKVYKTEFGMTDAIWELEVKNFPVVCMIDSHGKSFYRDVERHSKKQRRAMLV